MRTAVVLGAGGLTGQAFHLGVLAALADAAGFDARRADVVVGTSAGSLVAAALTAGLSAADQAALLHGQPLSAPGAALLRSGRSRAATLPRLPVSDAAARLTGRRPLAPGVLLAAARRPRGLRPGAIVSGLLPAGRVATTSIRRSIGQLHGPDWPGTRLRICAVRASDAQRVVFGTPGAPTTDVGTAVAASCAIPGYFAPVVIGPQAYVDGGAHSPTNADVLLADRPELVVISSPMTYGQGAAPRSADAVVRFAVGRYLAREVHRLRRGGATVLVFAPSAQDLVALGLNPMKGQRGPDVLRTAANTVRARLAAQPQLVEELRAAGP